MSKPRKPKKLTTRATTPRKRPPTKASRGRKAKIRARASRVRRPWKWKYVMLGPRELADLHEQIWQSVGMWRESEPHVPVEEFCDRVRLAILHVHRNARKNRVHPDQWPDVEALVDRVLAAVE